MTTLPAGLSRNSSNFIVRESPINETLPAKLPCASGVYAARPGEVPAEAPGDATGPAGAPALGFFAGLGFELRDVGEVSGAAGDPAAVPFDAAACATRRLICSACCLNAAEWNSLMASLAEVPARALSCEALADMPN
jgi:hypothetical protein